MPKTLLLTHPDCLDHDAGPRHPERPERLRAVLQALSGPDFAALERREAPEATRAQLARVHPEFHIDAVLATIPAEGRVAIDADTSVSPGSGRAALRAAGAVVAAVEAVVHGEARRAFCAVRPPGHHAEPATAMGFCLFNNVAVGAFHALRELGLRRVAVVDFDVHHGNGTQASAWSERRLDFFSSHQWPLYPGTGRPDETGPFGNIRNVTLPEGTDGAAFRARYEADVLPALEATDPDLILISAGFDAHRDDPLAGLALAPDDFAWLTTRLAEVAERVCGGRIVSTLEGGYDLNGLATSAAAHVRALMA